MIFTSGEFTCDPGCALDKLRDESLSKCLVKAENVEVKSDGKLNIRMAKPEKTAPGKQNFFFDNFTLKYHGKTETSGVASVEAEETITANTIVDVYTITGVTVAKGVSYAEAYAALGNGIYIVRSANTTIKVMK